MSEKEQIIFKKEAGPEIEERETVGEKERFEFEKPLFEAEPEEEKKEVKPEKAPEEKEKPAEEKETPQEKLEKLREQFRELKTKIETEKQTERAPFKDFEKYFVSYNRIELPEEKKKELEKSVEELQKKDVLKGPRIITGNKTATEYENRIANFSTQTAIRELSSGEKIFVVDSYPASLLHWLGVSFLRRMTGVKNFKSPNSVWKETFEKRSNIPTIKIANKNAVAMPYVENVKLGDLMTFNKEIKNWGSIEWAKDITLEDKKEIIGKIADEIEKIHRQGKTWGEAILANMIIGKDKKVFICDPEVLFYKEVPKISQKASDLKDLIFTASASLARSDGFKDYGEVVKLVLDDYGDKSVIAEAKAAAKQKPGFLQRLFFVYTKNRYFPLKDFKMHEEIRKAITEYKED